MDGSRSVAVVVCCINADALAKDSRGGSGALMDSLITFHNVSKFYGEALGVNRITLSIAPGITSLVGPNGAGKTTLMNLITGVLIPSGGTIEVLGIPPSDPERVFKHVG